MRRAPAPGRAPRLTAPPMSRQLGRGAGGVDVDETADELTGLLAAAAGGDRAAFGELYRRTSSKLYGIVLRICRRPELAAEVLQEAYLKIWLNAASFDRSRAAPVTWMATIARNGAIDAIRLRAEQITDPSDSPEDAIDFLEGLMAVSADRAELMTLRDCLSGLSGENRLMVLLGYCYGLSRQELSERFEMPANTVKTRLRRSLEALRRCLDGG